MGKFFGIETKEIKVKKTVFCNVGSGLSCSDSEGKDKELKKPRVAKFLLPPAH